MLTPEEISVGTLATAPPHSLMLPRGPYEHPFLIIPVKERKYAILLAGDHRFLAFECGGNENYFGLLVMGVRYEIDHSSVYDPAAHGAVAGSLVRRLDHLTIAAVDQGNRSFGRQTLLPLSDGLSPIPEGQSAGFRNWRIVLGEHPDQRVLHDVVA